LAVWIAFVQWLLPLPSTVSAALLGVLQLTFSTTLSPLSAAMTQTPK